MPTHPLIHLRIRPDGMQLRLERQEQETTTGLWCQGVKLDSQLRRSQQILFPGTITVPLAHH